MFAKISFFQSQLAGYDIAEFEQFIFAEKYVLRYPMSQFL
jgi:hypothetical protein